MQGVACSHRTPLPDVPLVSRIITIRDNADAIAIQTFTKTAGVLRVPVSGTISIYVSVIHVLSNCLMLSTSWMDTELCFKFGRSPIPDAGTELRKPSILRVRLWYVSTVRLFGASISKLEGDRSLFRVHPSIIGHTPLSGRLPIFVDESIYDTSNTLTGMVYYISFFYSHCSLRLSHLRCYLPGRKGRGQVLLSKSNTCSVGFGYACMYMVGIAISWVA